MSTSISEPAFHLDDFNRAADELCRYGKILYQRDWSPATSSNYSVRLDAIDPAQPVCALTSSGKHKGELQRDDILAVDMQGNISAHRQCHFNGRPSAETGLHTQLYRRDNNIGAVLHTHSKNAVVLSQIWPEDELVLQGWELQKALSGESSHEDTVRIPIFANDQNIERLAEKVEHYMSAQQQGQAYLIRGHGVYTWGVDLAECFRHLEALEHLLDYQLTLLKLGKI